MAQFIAIEDCTKILNKYYPSIKTRLLSFDINRHSENIIGFLGDHLRLTVYYQESNKEPAKVSFFVKCVPQGNTNANIFVTEMGVFQKELLLYRDLLPEMQKLVNVKFCPEHYLVNFENHCLVLENLADENFISKGTSFSDNEIEAMLQTLAAFHASSIIYEEKRSVGGDKYRLIDEFQEALKEGTFSAHIEHVRFKWGKVASKAVADCAVLHPLFANNTELKAKISMYLERHVEEYIKPSRSFRNVITHDDLWKNNIMFRVANDEKKIDCVLVDFQLTRYTPPVFDVLLALYLNVDSKKLRKLMPIYLSNYYEALSAQLLSNKINANTALSKQEFLKSIEIYRLPALFEAVMYGTNTLVGQKLSDIIMSDQDVFKSFYFYDRSKYVCQEFKENDNFRSRFSEVLVPFAECLMAQ